MCDNEKREYILFWRRKIRYWAREGSKVIGGGQGSSREDKTRPPMKLQVIGLNASVPPYVPPKNENGQTTRKKQKLYQKQGGLCAFCDMPFSYNDPATLDHIIPRSRGGSNTMKNFALVHRSCNLRKGDLLSYEEGKQRATEYLEMIKRLHDRGFLQ